MLQQQRYVHQDLNNSCNLMGISLKFPQQPYVPLKRPGSIKFKFRSSFPLQHVNSCSSAFFSIFSMNFWGYKLEARCYHAITLWQILQGNSSNILEVFGRCIWYIIVLLELHCQVLAPLLPCSFISLAYYFLKRSLYWLALVSFKSWFFGYSLLTT